MIPPERAVWRMFQLANLDVLTALYFNVHVGTIAGDDPHDPPTTRELRATLYAKRVDVIARSTVGTLVLEVKERVRPSAVGQLLVYLPLVLARFPDFAPLRPVLLAMTTDPDVQPVAQALGVECYSPPGLRLTRP
jgi:hypothetical protein